MKIISFDFEPSTQRGGQERSLFDVLSGFRKLGHEVQLGYVVEGNLLEKYKACGIRIVPISGINIFNKLSFREYSSFITSAFAFDRPSEHIVYINQIMDAPLAVAMKFIFGCKIICHLRLPPLGLSAQLKYCIKHIDRFIVPNVHMLNLHAKGGFPNKRMVVIPNGFWMGSISIPSKQVNGQFSIVYVGRLDSNKGVHVLIDAMALLKNRFQNFKLAIAGKFHSYQEAYILFLKNKIYEHGLDKEIQFVGHIDDPIQYLAKHDLCVFPSLWEEPFGRVIVESLLAGTPVIANNVGSVSEIMNDPPMDWIYNSVDELVQKIIILKDNPEVYNLDKRREFVKQNYDLENILPKIANVFKVG